MNYVEIGIMPYNQENAEYIYDILGRDRVKVVEGQQAEAEGELAETYSTSSDANDMGVEVAIDENQQESKPGAPNIATIYIVGALVLLGAGVVMLRRLKTTK
ncbi:MAG: hypothetical protein PHP06_09025 [Clostridia bacterium]|nr:hypothetical protein [Clostridia bacterium]